MKTKTIVTIILTALITVFLVRNDDRVDFDFFFTVISVSKLIVMAVCVVIGFIIGLLVARPKTVVSTYDPKFENEEEDLPNDTLNKEDRDYIS
ncbi:lipopolysaccharide assembly protein LapA domain-containing protein [Pedobacter flavus]|uniref:Lipopolysaccharide assembly protein LapA domain-containing protein n=1 Tax=Pedobacter flavus TaxID=3113906 RepID=A0ABU7H1Q4_9SPHI|nr:lipopolysaccharide assembly protein LapA domain-containing protein [Pedobacter sp. VNH31]MEE1885253.1 lipopolysaccharide assembly protein LapA domain-containing protein [Pedobacter sp. VNH31]